MEGKSIRYGTGFTGKLSTVIRGIRPLSSFGRALSRYPLKPKKGPMTTLTMRKATKTKIFPDVAQAAGCLVMIIALTVAATTAQSGEAKADAKSENKLVGTWKMISAKYGGEEFKFDPGLTTVKHVTPTQFMWASYDKDGKVTRTAGGSYTMKGATYEEMPEYGTGEDFDIIKGKSQTFKWKVEGNKWYHNGRLSNGLTIEEVWERVEKK